MIGHTTKKEQKPNRRSLLGWIDFETKLKAL